MSNFPTYRQSGAVDNKSSDNPLIIKNTTGFSVVPYAVGAIIWTTGSGAEFTLTTTTGQICAVVVGAASGANIQVVKSGRFPLTYVSTAPSAGDFLIPNSGTGQVLRQTYMSPEVCAIAMAAGSGGLVDALLFTNTLLVSVTDANDICRGDSVATSDFVATINGAPSGTSVTYNAPSSGAENCLVPNSSSQLAKMVLHNTTRGDSALISTANTGTNVITLTATVPAAWASGDTITIRSQTDTANPASNTYFVDFEITSVVNDMTRFINIFGFMFDTGAAGQQLFFHPYTTHSDPKSVPVNTQAASVVNGFSFSMPLIQKRFCMAWKTSGAATGLYGARLQGEGVAVP